MSAPTTLLPIEWNRRLCDALYLTNTPPSVAARAAAMMHTAMYDAMTLFLDGKETATTPLLQQLRRQANPCDYSPENRREAFSYAAFRMLTTYQAIFMPPVKPDKWAAFQRDLETFFCNLGYDPGYRAEDRDKASGIGNLAARLIFESRKTDGANQDGKFADTSGYNPKNPPPPELPLKEYIDRWQPLIQPANQKPQNFLTPHWGAVKPFALTSGGQFRPPAPKKPGDLSDRDPFKQQANELAQISAALSPKQKIIAEFWAGLHEDHFAGLPDKADYPYGVTPPAQLCRIGCEIIEEQQLKSVPAVTFLFVLTNALLDSSIACWEAKRCYDYLRPETAIHQLKDDDAPFLSWGGPGRGAVPMEGEGWTPYIPTPPFPEYVSGHSTFSAAAAEIVKCFFCDNRYVQQVTIQPGGSRIEGACEPALPTEPVTLSWNTVDEMAKEAAESRLYGGIHFKDGCEKGMELGKQVALCVWHKATTEFLNAC